MRWKFAAGVGLVLAVLGAVVAMVQVRRTQRLEDQAAELAQEISDAYATGTLPKPGREDMDARFMKLMKTPYGRSSLKKLAEDLNCIAFNERRNTVFYLYQDEAAVEGRTPRPLNTIARVTIDPTKSGDWRDIAHSGMPQYVTLKQVDIDGDSLWVDFVTSKDPKWRPTLKEKELEAGRKY